MPALAVSNRSIVSKNIIDTCLDVHSFGKRTIFRHEE